MKKKHIVITIIITLIVLGILVLQNNVQAKYYSATTLYKVYLKGNLIGMIDDKDSLYSLINQEQESIRDEYNVENVYPPSDFSIVETNTYDSKLSSVEEIYKKIEEEDNFTIKGYTITIKDDDDKTDDITINVTDKSIFENALKTFVHAFVSDADYQNYINGTQAQITSTGIRIDKMYFKESIAIKENYISVKDKIYTDQTSLSQYLLFGKSAEISSYEVKMGDTLDSIADENKLNTQELIIVNPQYRDSKTILKVGDKLNVTVLDPILNIVQEIYKVEDVDSDYQYETVYDNTKYSGYSEVTQNGVKGLDRLTEQYQLVNGEVSSGVTISNKQVLKEAINQITTKGKSYSYSGTYIDNGQEWAWPTNSPYIITSYFAYRWGKLHEGIDISGPGEGSPIYAAGDGVVVAAGYGGQASSEAGYNVIIQHADNYYTLYAHMAPGTIRVSVGQSVTRGQIIGGMGHTGFAYGTHLHFSVSVGNPYNGSYRFFNPLLLYK
jgi:murein DD-endopeptidase MepM/ murein hydrolase activator NlpD/type II secretory pathway pseudopilin PulG